MNRFPGHPGDFEPGAATLETDERLKCFACGCHFEREDGGETGRAYRLCCPECGSTDIDSVEH